MKGYSSISLTTLYINIYKCLTWIQYFIAQFLFWTVKQFYLLYNREISNNFELIIKFIKAIKIGNATTNYLQLSNLPHHIKLSEWWEWIPNLSCRKINKQLFMFRTVGKSNRTRELIIKQPSKPEPRYIDNRADRHEIIMIGHVLTVDHTPLFNRPLICNLAYERGVITLRTIFNENGNRQLVNIFW